MAVRRFWEKSPYTTAQKLLARGGLWNSFVMVGRVFAFLGLIKSVAPEIY
jgi:mannose-1-phosphate guanylyltransferase